jgi:hypothetical protein
LPKSNRDNNRHVCFKNNKETPDVAGVSQTSSPTVIGKAISSIASVVSWLSPMHLVMTKSSLEKQEEKERVDTIENRLKEALNDIEEYADTPLSAQSVTVIWNAKTGTTIVTEWNLKRELPSDDWLLHHTIGLSPLLAATRHLSKDKLILCRDIVRDADRLDAMVSKERHCTFYFFASLKITHK